MNPVTQVVGTHVRTALQQVDRCEQCDDGERYALQYARDAFFHVGEVLRSPQLSQSPVVRVMQGKWIDVCIATTKEENSVFPFGLHLDTLRTITNRYVTYLNKLVPDETEQKPA